MIDFLQCKGAYRFEGFNARGDKVLDKTFHNVVVQGFFDGVFAALDGTAPAIEVTHVATGDSATEAVKADTALGNEIFRKTVTSVTFTNTQMTVKSVLAASESVFTIKEVGIFAGTKLLSRCNVDIEKTGSIQLLISYTLTIQ